MAKNEGLLKKELDMLEAQARLAGVETLSGSAALEADRKPRGRNFTETVFADGDVVTIPPYPDKDNPKDTDKQWVALPIRGGDPITRVLCEVKNGNNTSYKQLFAGTLTKSVTHREKGHSVSVTGSIVPFIEDCIENVDIWEKIAGHKLTFVSHEMVPIVQRGFNGQPDRNKDTMVFKIDIK